MLKLKMKSKLSKKCTGNVTKDFLKITHKQHLMTEFVVNKAKRRISKRVSQENKARQFFQKARTQARVRIRR